MADKVKTLAEINTDELGRGYNGPGSENPGPGAMTDRQIHASLRAPTRNLRRSPLSGDQVFGVTDAAEFGLLSAHKQSLWLSFCARSEIDPFSAANVAFVQFIFGGGATVTALNDLRTVQNGQTRARELGLGDLRLGEIMTWRSGQ